MGIIKRVETLRLYEYMDDCLFEPGRRWPKYDRDVRIYSRWAIIELIDFINNNPRTPCLDLVNEFIDKMDGFYEESKNPKASLMFDAARETAKDTLDLFM